MVDIGKRRQNPAIVEAYQLVWPTLESADLRLYRLGYTEKSGRLAALFEILDQAPYQDALGLLKTLELYDELKAAEASFQTVYEQRVDEDSNREVSVEEARRVAVPHVNIFLGVLSTLEVFEPDVYDALAVRINSITSEIMTIARARKTRNEAPAYEPTTAADESVNDDSPVGLLN